MRRALPKLEPVTQDKVGQEQRGATEHFHLHQVHWDQRQPSAALLQVAVVGIDKQGSDRREQLHGCRRDGGRFGQISQWPESKKFWNDVEIEFELD